MRVRLGDYIKEYSVKNKNNEDIPVYSVSNSLGFCKDYFGKEVASKNKITYKIVPRGCFAYNPSRINVGSVDWQNEEERVIVSPLYNVFSVSPLLDQQYLLYYLKSNVILSRIRAVASGSVRDNLKLSMLYEFPIDLISLDQQYDVVSTLNAVQKIIDLYQKGLSYLDELVRARFVEMFGDPIENQKDWEVVKIRDIVTDVRYGTSKPAVEGGRYPYLRMNNLTVDGGLDLSDLKYIDIPDNEIEKCVVRKGDILFKMKLSDIKEKIASGSAQPQLPISTMNKIILMIPPLELQNQFASFVKEIDKSRLLSNHSLFLIKSIIF